MLAKGDSVVSIDTLQLRHNKGHGVSNRQSIQLFVKASIKEDIKVRITGPLRGESTGNWWIPLTKDQ